MERTAIRNIPRLVGALSLAGAFLLGSTPIARGTENSAPQPDSTPTPYTLFTPDYRPARIEDLIVNASSLATPTATFATRIEQLLPVQVREATSTPKPTEAAESTEDERKRKSQNGSNTKNRTGGDNDNNDNDNKKQTKNPTATPFRSCIPVSPEHCGPQPTQRPRQATPTPTPFRSCIPLPSSENCRPQPTQRPRVEATATKIEITLTPTDLRSCMPLPSSEQCRAKPTYTLR